MAKKDLLEDLAIRTAKPKEKPYTMRDGGSLFVLVHPNGSKYFHVRTRLHGKEKKIQLGTYPTVTLKMAREARNNALRMIKEGKDPVLAQRLAKQAESSDADNTFKKIAGDWLEIKARNLAPSSLSKIQKTFESNVFPVIGDYPIKQVNNLMVRKCLAPMQKRGALEYMSKTRNFILEVFKFALADNIIEENPIPEKDMRLIKHESKKHPRLKSLTDAGKLLRKLEGFQGSIEVQTCVYLQLHFAQRPSELRLAQWKEFDLDNAIWTIPLERSKTRKHMDEEKPHTVMLSKQAISALKALQQYTGGIGYLFASQVGDKPVSEASIRKAFRNMFTDYHVVPHGCRHLFSTQANESGLFRPEVIEAALSHKDDNKIRAVYNEATYDKERRKLAQWWSDQLDIARDGAEIVPFKHA